MNRLWAWLARTFPEVYLALMLWACGVADEVTKRMEDDK